MELSDYSEDFWEALIERVAESRPSLAAFLQAGTLISADEHKIVIGFKKQGRFSYANLKEPENLFVVKKSLESDYPRPEGVGFHVRLKSALYDLMSNPMGIALDPLGAAPISESTIILVKNKINRDFSFPIPVMLPFLGRPSPLSLGKQLVIV